VLQKLCFDLQSKPSEEKVRCVMLSQGKNNSLTRFLTSFASPNLHKTCDLLARLVQFLQVQDFSKENVPFLASG